MHSPLPLTMPWLLVLILLGLLLGPTMLPEGKSLSASAVLVCDCDIMAALETLWEVVEEVEELRGLVESSLDLRRVLEWFVCGFGNDEYKPSPASVAAYFVNQVNQGQRLGLLLFEGI